MHPAIRVSLLAIFFATAPFAASQNLAAADDEPAARALIERYTAALVAQDMAALRAVIHPQVLACITDDNRDYFDFMFAKDLGEGPIVAAKHKIARMGPPSDLSAFMPADLFTYPVPPAYEFQLDARKGYRFLTLVRTIAPHEGAWFVLLPCPTAKGAEMVREKLKQRAADEARARQLAAGLKDPILSEIKGLIAEKGRVSAAKRYSEAAGVDLTTATNVVDIVEPWRD